MDENFVYRNGAGSLVVHNACAEFVRGTCRQCEGEIFTGAEDTIVESFEGRRVLFCDAACRNTFFDNLEEDEPEEEEDETPDVVDPIIAEGRG